jgi:hypothetical protein
MKAAGIAPFIPLARRAWADPSPENMAAVAKIVPIPAAQLKLITAEAKLQFPTLDEDKFGLVASSLWLHFHYGLGLVEVGPELKDNLLIVMYDEPLTGKSLKTGARVAKNIVDGKFSPVGNDHNTNMCAYICGQKAAYLAVSQDKTMIDKSMYTAARKATESEMSFKLAKAKERSGAGGTNELMGFGC